MEKAYNKAIEGGWNPNTNTRNYIKTRVLDIDKDRIKELLLKESLFDPLFWQALSIAEKWEKLLPTGYFDNTETEIEDLGWKVQWHRFIDHLAQGKDINSFFDELLK